MTIQNIVLSNQLVSSICMKVANSGNEALQLPLNVQAFSMLKHVNKPTELCMQLSNGR